MSAQPQIARKYLHLAIEDASRCLADLAMILQQDEVQWDQARLGGIALGFERAAARVRGKMLTPKVDEAHKDDGGTMVQEKPALKGDPTEGLTVGQKLGQIFRPRIPQSTAGLDQASLPAPSPVDNSVTLADAKLTLNRHRAIAGDRDFSELGFAINHGVIRRDQGKTGPTGDQNIAALQMLCDVGIIREVSTSIYSWYEEPVKPKLLQPPEVLEPIAIDRLKTSSDDDLV